MKLGTTARIAYLISAALLLSSCSAIPAVTYDTEPALQTAPAPSSKTAPAPSSKTATASEKNTEAPDPLPDLSGAYYKLIYELQKTPPAYDGLIPEAAFESAEKYMPFFEEEREEYEWLFSLTDSIHAQTVQALEAAAEKTAELYGLKPSTNIAADSLPWQLVYAIIRSCSNAAQFNKAALCALEVSAHFESDGETLFANVNAELRSYKDALSSIGISEEACSSGCFIFEYFNTVYDENAQPKEYVLPPAEGSLKSGIVWPLASHTNLRKTWYAARDRGRRKHTGTDIWAEAGTDIYSCTDGRVIYVGYNERAGNAVTVEDGYGYIYQYCHMKQLTDFLTEGDAVTAGQKIGIVGSTGNSARNHLHLTIIAPSGVIIDPYSYLASVEPET